MAVRAAHASEALDYDTGDASPRPIVLAPGPLSGFRCLDEPGPCQRECRYRLDLARDKAVSRWTVPDAYGAYSPDSRAARKMRESLPLASCAILMANLGPLTLEQVGEQLGLTRERVRQIEEKALRRVVARSMSIKTDDGVRAAVELRKASEP